MKVQSSAVLFILAMTAGCQSAPPSSSGASPSSSSSSSGASSSDIVTAKSDNTKYSGFLSDYSQLKPASDREGVLLYVDKSADYRPYTKIMFDPVQVVVSPNPEQKEVPRDELARMGENLLSSFKQALAPEYQVVSTPGPDVLRVRTAITGIQPAKPSMGASDLLPIKAVFNMGRAAAGASPRVAEMAAEMEVLDPSGKRLVAATATRKGEKKLAQGDTVTWNDLKAINDYWAKGFRQRLDELRGVSRKG